MIKAYITAEEWRRVYFKYGGINALPQKALVDVEPTGDVVPEMAERIMLAKAKEEDERVLIFLQKLTLDEYKDFREFVNKKIARP